MISKSLATVVASLALLGSGLSAAQAAQPAQQSTGLATASVVAKCSNYPGSVYTNTNLRLRKHRVKQGHLNRAVVHVQAGIAKDPGGSVKVTVLPTNGSGGARRIYSRLHNGRTVVSLPRNLARGRYGVRANYNPGSCSRFASSDSSVKYYRVVRG